MFFFFSLVFERNTVEPFIVDLSLLRTFYWFQNAQLYIFSFIIQKAMHAMRTPGSVAFIKIRLKSARRGHRTISFSQILQDPISSHIGWFQMHSKRRHARFICFVVSSANPNNLKFIRVDLLFSRNDWLINSYSIY